MMLGDGLASVGPVMGSMMSAQSQQVESGSVASNALSTAKQLLAEHPTEPFPFEDLPKGRADPLWDEIRAQYKLSLLQLSALKNAVCINTPAVTNQFPSSSSSMRYGSTGTTSSAAVTVASIPSTSGGSARKRRAAQVDATSVEASFLSGPSTLLPSLSLVNDPYLHSIPSLAAAAAFPTDAVTDLSGMPQPQPHSQHSHSHPSQQPPQPPEKRPRKQPRRKYDFDLIKLAIIRYEEVHGNLHIARDFAIPMGSPDWPEELWGMELGVSLREIKRFRAHANRREELRELGYDLDTPGMVNGHRKNFKFSYEHVKAALLKYKEINGDMKVMVKFVVPIGDETWPRETWGLELGRYVQLIRGGKVFSRHRFELATLGFSFDSQRKYGYDLLRAALKKYSELHGSVMPKYNFVVPRGDGNWPKSMWGMNLGSVVQDVKKGECYRDKKEELEAMGFEYPANWPKETKKARKKKRQLEEAGQQGLLQMARI